MGSSPEDGRLVAAALEQAQAQVAGNAGVGEAHEQHHRGLDQARRCERARVHGVGSQVDGGAVMIRRAAA